MSGKIISGNEISKKIKDELKIKIESFSDELGKPCLVVVLVGDDPASKVYVGNKEKACDYLGIKSDVIRLPESTSEQEVIDLVTKLSNDNSVHGILVQMPLPKHINPQNIINNITFEKDVDGFNPINVGLLQSGAGGEDLMIPCTANGVIKMLESTLEEIGETFTGKNCVVVGRSNIVGKPVACMLTNKDATVTICHSKTVGLKEICLGADILVCAVGRIGTITKDMVKENGIVIDVGINRGEDGKLKGDVNFDEVMEVASYVTPVPGGVGPMTIAMLMRNCITAFENLVVNK